MILLSKKKAFIRIEEVYFSDDYSYTSTADVIFLKYSPIARSGGKVAYSLHLDLKNIDEDTIFQRMGKNTKYEINRAELRDNLSILLTCTPSDDEVNSFSLFYNKFAKNKKLSLCDNVLLHELKKQNVLVLSNAKDETGNLLCCHAYIINKNEVRLLYSASHFRMVEGNERRALIGRANRYLHWFDIKNFKNKGYDIYDFGGLTMTKGNSIDEFKFGFGGEVVEEYNAVRCNSVCGWLAVLWLRCKIFHIYHFLRK